MISLTGNRQSGFTLIEIMITTAILSLGIVFIYQAFFISMDSLDYCSEYLEAGCLASEKIWEVMNHIERFGPASVIEKSGVFFGGKRELEWEMYCDLTDEALDLYEIRLDISDRAGKRKIKLSRTAYAIYEED